MGRENTEEKNWIDVEHRRKKNVLKQFIYPAIIKLLRLAFFKKRYFYVEDRLKDTRTTRKILRTKTGTVVGACVSATERYMGKIHFGLI